MHYKILIVDDEPKACANLLSKVEALEPDSDVRTCTSPVKALDEISSWQPDMVFLDIKMPVLSGFELLDHISEDHRKFALIFCTAYSEYAVDAFDRAAVDYLLKPVDPERLKKALLKGHRAVSGSWSKAVDSLQDKPFLRRIAVKLRGRIELIDCEAIAYFSSESHETILYTSDGKEYVCDFSLAALEQRLDPRYFIRSHRAYLVNVSFIASLDGQSAILCDMLGTIPVSKRKKAEVKKKITDF